MSPRLVLKVVMEVALYVVGSLVALAGLAGALSVRVVQQIERGVVFWFGRVQPELRRPGLTKLVPVVHHRRRNVQVVTMPVLGRITRDNATVRVDAVVYFKGIDPEWAVVA